MGVSTALMLAVPAIGLAQTTVPSAPRERVTVGLVPNKLRRTDDGSSRFWIYGLRYTPIQWPTSRANASYDNDLALTIGHGWDQTFADGMRCGDEPGFGDHPTSMSLRTERTSESE